MKKLKMNSLWIVLVFAALSNSCSHRQDGSHPSVVAVRTHEAMVIDGLLGEPVWREAEEIVLRNNRPDSTAVDAAVMTRAKACYDDDNLYFSFDCDDPDIWSTFTQRDEYLWTQENVEIFLDTDPGENTYVEIEVSPANVVYDSYIVDPVDIDVEATKQFNLPGLKTAVTVEGTLNERSDRDRRWTVEIAIPFRDLVEDAGAFDPVETVWRINFYRINNDFNERTAGYAWSPTGGRFHKPSVFGRLIFEK